jgi:hypothetical protein
MSEVLDMEKFLKLYDKYSQKDKIEVTCSVSGRKHIVTKEKVQSNIEKNGMYIDRITSMEMYYQNNPMSEERKRKISEVKLGKTKSEETKQKMKESAKRRWIFESGKKERNKLSEKAAKQNASGSINKSKRKILYISKLNNNEVRVCLSSYEFIYCEDFLEKDENVASYETQVPYQVGDKYRSFDFLVTYKDGRKVVVEIKPKKFLELEFHAQQLENSLQYAIDNNYDHIVLTEKELGIIRSVDATKRADEYRKINYKIDFISYKQERNKLKAKKHYDKHIKNNKVTIYCDFCKCYHNVLNIAYMDNVEKNGRFRCRRENCHEIGKKDKSHLKKVNLYALEGKKQCNKCKMILLIDDFSIDNNKEDKHGNICKTCKRETEKLRKERKIQEQLNLHNWKYVSPVENDKGKMFNLICNNNHTVILSQTQILNKQLYCDQCNSNNNDN